MAQEDLTKAHVSIINIPKRFGLWQSRKLLQETLGNKNAVTEVKLFSNDHSNGHIAGLCEEKYAEILLAKDIIYVDFEDTIHQLKIARPKPASEKPETSSNKETVTPTTEKVAERGSACNESITSNQCLRQYDYLPEIDNDIVEYVRRSANLSKELSLCLYELANIEFVPKYSIRADPSYFVRCIPLPRDRMRKELQNNQQQFEDKCCFFINNYLAKFTSLTSQFKEEMIDLIRKDHLWNEDSDCIKVEFDENHVAHVFVRWKYPNRGCIKVVAHKDDVSVVMKWLTQRCDLSDECVAYTEQNLQICELCGIIKEVTQQFQSKNVEITVDVKNLNLTFKGPTQEVTSAKDVITNTLQGIKSCKLSFLDDMQVRFLTDALAPGRTYNDKLVKIIKHKFQAYQVKAYLGQQMGQSVLFYNQRRDLKLVTTLLKNLIKTEKIDVGEDINELLQSQEWKIMERRLNSSGNSRMCINKQSSTIFIIGLAETVKAYQKQVLDLIKAYAIESRVVNIPYAVALFISQYHKDVHTENGLKEVEWQITSENSGGILIKGKLHETTKAEGWIKDEASLIQTTSHSVSEPGMKKYLHGTTGKQFLKTIEAISKCVILIDTNQYPNLKPISQKSESPATPTEVYGFALNVTFHVGNIADHSADVIVTARGPHWQSTFIGSSVFKALLQKAGHDFKDAYKMAIKNTPIAAGEVVQTLGYDLSCKKVYHMFLNKYDASTGRSEFIKAIQKCLTMADSDGFTRIAFPTIGTGGLKYPAQHVAQWFKSEIVKFKGTNLRHVDFVLFPTDQATNAAFRNAFQSSHVAVSVKTGNILGSDCDVIVNTTSNFNLAGGQLCKKLLTLTGNTVVNECINSPLHSSTAYRVTSGGNLPFKNIVHIITPSSAQALVNVLNDVLDLVDQQMMLTSIAIPAIGTGKGCLRGGDVAGALQTAIQRFSNINPTYLRRIDVVVFEASMIPHLQSALDRTTVYICAKEQSNSDDALERLREHVKDKTSTKSIESEAIGSLCSAEVDELMSLQSKHDVIIHEARSPTGQIKLVVSGLKDDVMDAFTSVSGIIQDYKEALTCAEYVTWKYTDNHTQQMKDFSLCSSWQIESAYKKNNKGQITVPIKIGGRNYNFLVDFSTMQETCLETKVVVKVIRFLKSSSDDFPSTWDDTGDVLWKLVELSSLSAEYRCVVRKFISTGPMGFKNVCRLERIQNPTLYKQFQAQKRKVEERMKRDGCNFQVARQLFHGTSADVCDKIYKDGFDRSHAGKNATAFGRGVYFATTSQYSQRFAKPDANGEMRMFLADVITGEFCKGNSSMKTPPVKPGHTNELYDSVVNNVSNPSIFVVFKDASVYPAYILTFK